MTVIKFCMHMICYNYIIHVQWLQINFECRCNWVRVDGNEYKISTGVILNVEHDLPVVGVIRDIYIVNEDKVLFCVDQSSTSYEPHFRAYIVESDSCSRIVCH